MRGSYVQTGSPVQLEVVAFVEGAIALEQKLHRTFRKLRTQGEWFVCEGKLQELVWYLSDEFGKAAPPGTFDAAIHDVVLADLPEQTRMKAMRSRWFGSILACTLKTKPDTFVSSGVT